MKHLLMVLSRSHINMKIAEPLTRALDQAGYSAIILWVRRSTDVPVEMFRLTTLTELDLQQVLDLVSKFNSESEPKQVILQ